jgi:hypothetical protein
MFVEKQHTIYHVSQESLTKMIFFPEGSFETLEEHTLEVMYQELPQADKENLLRNLLSLNTPFPTSSPPFQSGIFLKTTKHALAITFQVLGYNHNKLVDKAILGLFSLWLSTTSMVLQNLITVRSLRNSCKLSWKTSIALDPSGINPI